MIRKDRAPQPIERRRTGPVIERVGQGAPQKGKAITKVVFAVFAMGLLLLLGDGHLFRDLFDTFENKGAPSPVVRPDLPQGDLSRAGPPRSEPQRPEPARPTPPRAEAPRPAPPISQPAPAVPPVASAPPVVPAPPPSAATPAPPAPSRATLLLPRPPGARPAVAPFADADVTQVVTKQIRRFNESRDVNEKQDASRQIHAAALIGHPLARSIIVSAYRTSSIVQNASSPADVVRIALDFAARGQGDSAAARGFAALAGYLVERDDAVFGQAVLDAMRDDARLREPAVARTVLDSLAASPRACAALAAAAGAAPGAGCEAVLANALIAQAVARGAAGQEDAAYKSAERAFARYLQEAL